MRSLIKAASIVVLPSLLAACSSSPISSLGSIGSIGGKKSISGTDRVFLAAAGSWDRNRDSTVTCDEWKAYARELSNSADANRDGAVDASEWGRITANDRMFETADLKYFDANGDGKVSEAEFVDKPNPAFTLIDTEKTCTLSSTQIAGARSRTEFDTSGKKAADPRDAEDKAGQATSGRGS